MVSTYQVVGFEAYVREIDETTTTKFWQHMTLYVKSAANTQLTYDIGSYVAGSLGTFWTAAIADTTVVSAANPAQGVVFAPGTTSTTQGAIATQALATLQNIAGVLAENLITVSSPYILPFIQVASGASGSQYILTVVNDAPTYTFGTASGPTTVVPIFITWDLSPGNHGVKSPLSYF